MIFILSVIKNNVIFMVFHVFQYLKKYLFESLNVNVFFPIRIMVIGARKALERPFDGFIALFFRVRIKQNRMKG